MDPGRRQSSPSSDRRRAAARARRERTPDADMPMAWPISVASNPDTWRSARTSGPPAKGVAARPRGPIAAEPRTGRASSEPTSATSISTTGSGAAAHDLPHLVRGDRHQPRPQPSGSRSEPKLAPGDRPSGLHGVLGHVLVAADHEADTRHVVVVLGDDAGEGTASPAAACATTIAVMPTGCRQFALHALQMLLIVQLSHPGVEIGGQSTLAAPGRRPGWDSWCGTMHLERWTQAEDGRMTSGARTGSAP